MLADCRMRRMPCLKKGDSLRDLARTEEWDLSWYDCFLAFESKKREIERTFNTSENKIQLPKHRNEPMNVTIPLSILKQLEAVKLQLTEFQILLDQKEQIVKENEKLSRAIREVEKKNSLVRNKYEAKIKKTDQKIGKMQYLFCDAEVQNMDLKKEIASRRKKEERRKRQRDRTLTQLAVLRHIQTVDQQNKKEYDQQRNSFSTVQSSQSSTSSLLDAVSNIMEDHNESSEEEEMKYTEQNKQKMLSSLVKDLNQKQTKLFKEDDNASVSSDSSGKSLDLGKSYVGMKNRKNLNKSGLRNVFDELANESERDFDGFSSTVW